MGKRRRITTLEDGSAAESVRAGRTARKKSVPSEKQRSEDARLRKELANADMSKFERIFRQTKWVSGSAKKS